MFLKIQFAGSTSVFSTYLNFYIKDLKLLAFATSLLRLVASSEKKP